MLDPTLVQNVQTDDTMNAGRDVRGLPDSFTALRSHSPRLRTVGLQMPHGQPPPFLP